MFLKDPNRFVFNSLMMKSNIHVQTTSVWTPTSATASPVKRDVKRDVVTPKTPTTSSRTLFQNPASPGTGGDSKSFQGTNSAAASSKTTPLSPMGGRTIVPNVGQSLWTLFCNSGIPLNVSRDTGTTVSQIQCETFAELQVGNDNGPVRCRVIAVLDDKYVKVSCVLLQLQLAGDP